MQVLITEDDADSADSLALLLRVWGHEVRVARSGPEALRVVSEFQPEIALVDIMMPVMDGYEVARRIREQQKGIILVALTGMTGPDHVKHCQEAGFVALLVKPVRPDLLRKLLGG